MLSAQWTTILAEQNTRQLERESPTMRGDVESNADEERDSLDSAIDELVQIGMHSVSYVYHALFAYFDRDNVALKGLAKFFKESSVEVREHAEAFMEYQNKRGGRVKLQSILMPLSEFDHEEKGDALYAMELALSLEKLVNEKLLIALCKKPSIRFVL